MANIYIKDNQLWVDSRGITLKSPNPDRMGLESIGITEADDASEITLSGFSKEGKPFKVHYGPGMKLVEIDPLPGK